MTLWTKLADAQPPPLDAPYLVYGPSGDPASPFLLIAWYGPANGWNLPTSIKESLTHWMELPEPPPEPPADDF